MRAPKSLVKRGRKNVEERLRKVICRELEDHRATGGMTSDVNSYIERSPAWEHDDYARPTIGFRRNS